MPEQFYGGPSMQAYTAQRERNAKAQRIRDDLYIGRTTIQSMQFEDRVLAEEHDIITGRDITFAFWDGSYPPPAEIRCHERKHEQLGPNTNRVSCCMLLAGHASKCDFTER
jgi:hypothetical protein